MQELSGAFDTFKNELIPDLNGVALRFHFVAWHYSKQSCFRIFSFQFYLKQGDQISLTFLTPISSFKMEAIRYVMTYNIGPLQYTIMLLASVQEV